MWYLVSSSSQCSQCSRCSPQGAHRCRSRFVLRRPGRRRLARCLPVVYRESGIFTPVGLCTDTAPACTTWSHRHHLPHVCVRGASSQADDIAQQRIFIAVSSGILLKGSRAHSAPGADPRRGGWPRSLGEPHFACGCVSARALLTLGRAHRGCLPGCSLLWAGALAPGLGGWSPACRAPPTRTIALWYCRREGRPLSQAAGPRFERHPAARHRLPSTRQRARSAGASCASAWRAALTWRRASCGEPK